MIENSLKPVIDKLSTVVLGCFDQTYYFGESQGVFRSHFDWHSSVHAHWMLLSSSRITGNMSLNNQIKARFNQSVIDSEREKLLSNPKFELPYGQAWLLLLLTELEKNNEIDVSDFKNETAVRLFEWLAKTNFPEISKNAYHSWLFTYFLIKKCKMSNLSEEFIKIDLKFNSVASVMDENDPKDFFSSESLFRLIKNIPNPNSDFVEQLMKCSPVKTENCHTVGKIISKSWAMPSIQKDALDKTVHFVETIIKEPQFWKNDFKTVSHWVPQFLWLGVWLALAEP